MYNLDVVIAVGYRVNSYEARIWARNVLKEYIVKGFVMDDERLKGKNPFGAAFAIFRVVMTWIWKKYSA